MRRISPWALREGEIAAAGLDVLAVEPMSRENPLMEIQDSRRLIITPHIAWAPVETRARLLDEVYRNIQAFLNAKPVIWFDFLFNHCWLPQFGLAFKEVFM